jgi:hypothetical protein
LLQVEALERRVTAERLVAVTAMAGGAKDVTMPDPDKVRAEFDAALEAEPRVVAVDELALRRRLGVA